MKKYIRILLTIFVIIACVVPILGYSINADYTKADTSNISTDTCRGIVSIGCFVCMPGRCPTVKTEDNMLINENFDKKN